MQNIGRINRYGEYDSSKIYYIDYNMVDNNTKLSEQSAAQISMGLHIINRWNEYLCSYIKSKKLFTLDELYIIYNSFQQNNVSEINDLIKNWYTGSTKTLSEFDFTKIRVTNTPKKKKSTVIKKPKYGLRECGGFFITMKDIHGEWISPENVFSVKNNEVKNIYEDNIGMKGYRQIGKLKRELVGAGYTAFEDVFKNVERHNKNLFPTLKRIANSSETPFPVFTKIYNPELGVLDNI
jgi:hypothetical protein